LASSRATGEDVVGHQSSHLLLGFDPAMHLDESQPQILLNTFVEPAKVGLIADSGCILEELDVCHAREADLVVRPCLELV